MKVKFSRCNSNSLTNVPQVDGQLIYVKDTHEVYIDVGNDRNNITDFISKTNTTVFTPTGDYQPTTKKYVDDTIADALQAENTSFDPTGTGMESTNVEDAIIELNDKIGDLGNVLDDLNGEVI